MLTGRRNNNSLVPLKMREDMFQDAFFSSSWHEFDESRNQMMKKNSDFWDAVDADMKKFERDIAALEADMDTRMAPHRPSVPSWAVAEHQRHNWPVLDVKPKGQVGHMSDRIRESREAWEVEVDVSEYDPERVRLSVAGDVVTVHAETAKENTSNTFRQSTTIHSLTKRFTLPPGCDPDYISSRLSAQGILLVTCPRKLYLDGASPKAVRW